MVQRRKQAKYGCLAGIGIFVLLMVGSAVFGKWLFPDTFSAAAKDYKEVRNLRLVGYLPETMPKSVRDLKVTWNIDRNTANARFVVSAEDVPQLTKGFSALPPDNLGIQRFSRERDGQKETLTIDTRSGAVEWSTQ